MPAMAADEGAPDERSAVAGAIGGAAAYSARVAARVWRRPLEAAAEELLATPEVRQALDRTLSSPLPEELGKLLVRHRVVERVVHELVVSGELERTLQTTLMKIHATTNSPMAPATKSPATFSQNLNP